LHISHFKTLRLNRPNRIIRHVTILAQESSVWSVSYFWFAIGFVPASRLT
jgi:hypothetical protein